ncbi:MAG: hypothetical protein RL358_1411 [Pseudomonadota bacterium]|jgi:hypothetical protein
MCRIINKIAGWVAAILTGVMCFSFLAQADIVPISNSVQFDHTQTGFVLRDVHTTLKCEQCHVGGVFKNTPKECAGCHTIGSRVGATPKPINHVQTTFSCDTCHVSPTSFLVKSFQHFGIVNGCAACHSDTANQSIGVVKINRATHITTFLPCENCHINTSTFLSSRMDHTGISSGCATCHGGQSGKVVSQPIAHIPTNGLDCGACHNTTTFLGATFSHTGTVIGVCGSCHGVQPGVRAKPALHIPTFATGNACDVCHTASNTAGYTSFLGAMYHQNAAGAPSPIGTCSTCHNGAYPGVYGTSFLPNHNTIVPLPTPQCDTCHTAANTGNYTTFMGAIFTHPGTVVTPSAAPTGPNACGTCHNGTTAKTYGPTHAVINRAATKCDSCHTNSLTTLTWLGATINHSAMVGYPAPCANCHNGTSAKGKPSTHLVTAMACDSCHSNSITTLSWLGASGVNHALLNPAAAGRCQSCHNGSTAKGLSPGHIPVGVLSCDTGGCHTVGAAITFAPGQMGSAQHAVVVGTRCDVCHSGAYATQGLNLGGAVGKVSNHIPTTITGALDCNTCHKTPNHAMAGAAGWATKVGEMNHNNAQGGAPNYCVTCHLTGVAYMGAMQKKNHNGSSAAKDCSSSSCHKPMGKTGAAYTSWK